MNTSKHNPQHLPNHIAVDSGDGSAMIIIASSPDLDPKRPPAIHRFYREPGCLAPMDRGLVIGHGLGDHCALLVKADPYSLVAVTEPLRDDARVRWSYYQIDPNWRLIQVESAKKLTYGDIQRHLSTLPAHRTASFVLVDADIEVISRGPQPDWLRRTMDAQLVEWRHHQPALHARVATDLSIESDIDRCVEAAPMVMLDRWRHRLSPAQLRRCIELSPEGAVRYAIDHIPPDYREPYLSHHAAEALANSIGKLSVYDLVICTEACPQLAYDMRLELSPDRRACVLATVYRFLWPPSLTPPPEKVRHEILASIRESPQAWLALHEESFIQTFHELERRASIRPGWDDIGDLIQQADPAVGKAVREFLASRI